MSRPALMLMVRFKSALPMEEITTIMEERAPEFEALTGLQQKYYFYDPELGEIGGLYLWASSEDLDAYRDSGLRATIAKAYQAAGEPRVEVFRVLKALRETP